MNKMMLKKQYMMYAPKKKGRLPSEYQEVEYIQGTGTQCIDTGLIPTKANQFELDFSLQEKVNTRLYGMFGGYALGLNEANTFWGCGSDLTLGDIFTLNERYILKQDTRTNQATLNIETYNGVNIGNWTQQYSSMATDVNVYILDMKVSWATIFAPAKAKVYGCKIHNGDTLVRDFIPCYRKSDNEIGLYDIVNNQFYTNQGSGSFLKGKDVIYTSTNAVSFATDSWSTIQAEAERISNFYEEYGFIPFNTPYAIYNPENNDTNNIRTIVYNNEEIQIAIIGMCHDTLQTPYSGGGTKAGITWQTTKSLFKSAVDSSSSSGGWSSCSLRASLNSTHFNLLPQEMQNAIKVVAKKSNNGSGSITTSNDKLFTLSIVEIMGTTKRNSSTNLAIEGEGTQYEYYKNAPLIIDSKNITWTGLSGTKGTCIANGNSYITLIDGVQTPDANDYVNYRNAKVYKPNGNASYYGTRSFKEANNECMYVWRAGNITYTTASNSDLEVCFAGCI